YSLTYIDRPKIHAILNDLSLGSRGVQTRDPALQPIIPLGNDDIVIAPSLWLSLSLERNLMVLLNRLPEERERYSRLVGQKEELMQSELIAAAGPTGLRTWHGRLPARDDLPDVDLALIDDAKGIALLCELKWFIDPAEVREVVTKSDEIGTGVRQMKAL